VCGAILSKAAETYGRPVAYVILEAGADLLEDGDWVRVDEALLENTINYCLLKEGIAYYTIYTYTPFSHRRPLSEVASEAQDANKGIWELDMTTEFILEDKDSAGPGGQLILPKLFRRCMDYLKAVEKGFKGDLEDWLIWYPPGQEMKTTG
jgi:endonuclease YncB( thermonuclease family)